MNSGDSASLATVAIVMGFVLISGPLVPAVDFTVSSFGAAAVNEGSNFTVSKVTVQSDGPRIRPGRFEWQAVLDAPKITVRLDRVSGTPLLVYELSVSGLSHNVVSLVQLDEQDAGRTLTVDIENSTLRTREVTNSSYPAEIQVRVRSGNETTTLFRTNLTVAVGVSNSD